MKERPILFSGLMVRAILRGEKCATRRIIKPQPPVFSSLPYWIAHSTERSEVGKWKWTGGRSPTAKTVHGPIACPYGVPGDRLWVRESCYIHHVNGPQGDDGHRWGSWSALPSTVNPDRTQVAYYKEGFDLSPPRWRPSIHMPRWASRITLEIETIAVQRLQDMTEADAIEEGADTLAQDSDFMEARYQVYLDRWHTWRADGCVGREPVGPTKLEMFQDLWVEINGDDAWRDNPAVWVVRFKRVEQ